MNRKTIAQIVADHADDIVKDIDQAIKFIHENFVSDGGDHTVVDDVNGVSYIFRGSKEQLDNICKITEATVFEIVDRYAEMAERGEIA